MGGRGCNNNTNVPIPVNYTLKNGQDGKFHITCILTQLEICLKIIGLGATASCKSFVLWGLCYLCELKGSHLFQMWGEVLESEI